VTNQISDLRRNHVTYQCHITTSFTIIAQASRFQLVPHHTLSVCSSSYPTRQVAQPGALNAAGLLPSFIPYVHNQYTKAAGAVRGYIPIFSMPSASFPVFSFLLESYLTGQNVKLADPGTNPLANPVARPPHTSTINQTHSETAGPLSGADNNATDTKIECAQTCPLAARNLGEN